MTGDPRDKAMMQDCLQWPAWPYLPVKRKNNSLEDRNLGVLWVGSSGLTVHHVYMFDLPPTAEEFKKMPSTVYKDLDSLLADGWIVD